jgi:hypothetical protein
VKRFLVRGDQLLAGIGLRGHGPRILFDEFDAGRVAGGAGEAGVASDERGVE